MKIKDFVSNHESEMLVLTGVSLLGLGMPMSAYSGINIYKKLDEFRDKNGKINKKDLVLKTWKDWMPPVVMFGAGSFCVVRGGQVQNKKIAALTALIAMTQDTLKDFKEGVKETVTDSVYETIKEKAAIKNEEHNPIVEDRIESPKDEKVQLKPDGDLVVFRDPITKRDFRSSKALIEKAVAELNYRLMVFDHQSLNDFYELIGLETVSQEFGESLGWSVRSGKVHMEFIGAVTDEGIPFVVIDYGVNAPMYGYEGI